MMIGSSFLNFPPITTTLASPPQTPWQRSSPLSNQKVSTFSIRNEVEDTGKCSTVGTGGSLDAYKVKEFQFLEVGLIRSTHGVKGELKVISRTDFPEVRFEQPGVRWVGVNQMGNFVGIRQVELIGGRRIIQGKEPTWLLTFQGFDTVEKASELLGSTILVKDDDKPTLKADQLYIPDMIGMSVELKESGQFIGSIVDVFSSGANDLLRVKLLPSDESIYQKDDSEDIFAWIPFVEEIVPVVDMESRKVMIVPPSGLLELGIPSKKPPKQKLKKEALKMRRKLQEKLSGVKKRVLALKQEHILSGLTHGEEIQKEALKAQLLDIDFKLFKHAVDTALKDAKSQCDFKYSFHRDVVFSPDWESLNELISSSSKALVYNNKVNRWTWDMWLKGLELVAENKVAFVVVSHEECATKTVTEQCWKLSLQYHMQQVHLMQELAEHISSGEKCVIPLVVVIPEGLEKLTDVILNDEAYFGLHNSQVFAIRSSCLPVISHNAEERSYNILMESPWSIQTAPAGEGHVIMDLNDSGALNDLIEMGVKYIHVSAANPCLKKTDPVIFGIMNETDANIALRVTSEILEGSHGILCVENMENRKYSKLQEGTEKTRNGNHNVALSPHNYCIVNPDILRSSELDPAKDDEVVFRVPSICNYTYSVEYLRHISEQRYDFRYEAISKIASDTDGISAKCLNAGSDVNNVVKFKCCIDSSLSFSPVSKVVLINHDTINL